MQQLTFNIRPHEDATFDNYYVGDNVLALNYLKQAASLQTERFIYCFGLVGSGLTHLMQASCHWAEQQQKKAVYLPCKQIVNFPTQVLEDIEALNFICIDDIDLIAGNREWEEAIFHLYNRVMLSSSVLVLSGKKSISEINFILPDLKSRLSACVVFQIKSLGEDAKKAVLLQRAQQRGLVLNEDAADYLLTHFPRDAHSLFAALEKLDDASWQAQRKITVPFIKLVLDIG